MATTTKTLAPAGDYSSMSTWESTEQTTLTAGNYHVLDCYDHALSNTCLLSGWGTGATNYVTIKAANGEDHAGNPAQGFRMTGTSNFATTLEIAQDYTRVTGISCHATGNGGYGFEVSNGADHVVIDQCIGSGGAGGTNSGGTAFRGGTIANGAQFRNCWAQESRNGFMNLATAAHWTCHNCFAEDADLYGFRISGGAVIKAELKNCLGYGSGTADYDESGTSSFTGNKNASEDLTAVGTNPEISITTADFEDYAGADYHPADGGDLHDNGEDLSGTFTTDIAGTTRTTWDIGAWYTEVAATGYAHEPYSITAWDELTGVLKSAISKVSGA